MRIQRAAVVLASVLLGCPSPPQPDGGNALDSGVDGGGTDAGALADGGCLTSHLSIAPSSYSFGSVSLGQTSAPTTFTVTNGLCVTTTALTVALTGAGASAFAVVAASDTCSGVTLAPGTSCTLAVTFSPNNSGAVFASLEVAALSGGKTSAALSGIACGGCDMLTISPTPCDFGPVPLYQRSQPATFTVAYSGPLPSGTVRTSLNGPSAADFVILDGGDQCSGISLPVNATCTIDVAFVPSTLGAKSATLTVSAVIAAQDQTSLGGTGILLDAGVDAGSPDG